MVLQVSEPTYRRYLNDLLFAHIGETRALGSSGRDAAAVSIQNTFAAFGLRTTTERFTYQDRTCANVSAVWPGKFRPGDYVVIGAHYDSVNDVPGADDDGSGIAALLEAARVASQHDFEASVVFVAFDGEETRGIGSHGWVIMHPQDHVVSMLQMDMIAFNPPGPRYNTIAVMTANDSAAQHRPSRNLCLFGLRANGASKSTVSPR